MHKDFSNRNRMIRRLSEDGVKTSFLIAKYGLSKSRIYDILKQKEKRCLVHDRLYYTNCSQCTRLNEKLGFINKHYRGKLRDEIIHAASLGRTVAEIEKKKKLVEKLHKKYGLSFAFIGELLGMKHSSVLNLHKK